MKPVYLNGKFYAGGMNGVHRVADSLIRELDSQIARQASPMRATLLLPVNRQWQPRLTSIDVAEQPRGHSTFWEQAMLPRLAADGVLVNLCNLAPIMHRCKLTLIHDAQFRFEGNSYPWRRRLWYNSMIPLAARTSKRVLTVSQYSKDILDLLGISPAYKTGVLHNGLDHLDGERREDQVIGGSSSVNAPFVMFFGSTKRYKNAQIIFEAFRDPRLSSVALAVIGQGREEFAKADFALPENAQFLGRIDDAAILNLYRTAIGIVFPSRTEGFGLPPGEAMQAGCPAIVAPAGAIPEVCRDAVLYADVDDAASWVEAILAIRDIEALRQRKITEGRVRASLFPWASAGATLMSEIERLAEIGR